MLAKTLTRDLITEVSTQGVKLDHLKITFARVAINWESGETIDWESGETMTWEEKAV